jgi:hypothetical protein
VETEDARQTGRRRRRRRSRDWDDAGAAIILVSVFDVFRKLEERGRRAWAEGCT